MYEFLKKNYDGISGEIHERFPRGSLWLVSGGSSGEISEAVHWKCSELTSTRKPEGKIFWIGFLEEFPKI